MYVYVYSRTWTHAMPTRRPSLARVTLGYILFLASLPVEPPDWCSNIYVKNVALDEDQTHSKVNFERVLTGSIFCLPWF